MTMRHQTRNSKHRTYPKFSFKILSQRSLMHKLTCVHLFIHRSNCVVMRQQLRPFQNVNDSWNILMTIICFVRLLSVFLYFYNSCEHSSVIWTPEQKRYLQLIDIGLRSWHVLKSLTHTMCWTGNYKNILCFGSCMKFHETVSNTFRYSTKLTVINW